MQRVFLITLLLGFTTTLTLSLSLPSGKNENGQDLDTVSIDETTTVSPVYEAAVTNNIVPSEPLDEEAIPLQGQNQQECTTSRGLMGSCMEVNNCFKILAPLEKDGRIPDQKIELAQMLVNASGFCAGDLEARDVTPRVYEQIMRSEVMVCCPEERKVPPSSSFTLDEPSAENAYSDPFKARSCGYLRVVDLDKLPEYNTTAVPELGSTTEQPKIVKGRKTRPGEFPWIVAMLNNGRQFCGASLLDNYNVLTAAHCVQHMTANDVKNLKLSIGDHTLYTSKEAPSVLRNARKVLYHKGFSMKHLQHDIALIHLEKPVTFADNIQPVCLHPGNPSVETGSVRSDVAGWGALSEGGSQPNDLRAVQVRVITKSDCLKKYSGSANKVTDGMICAGSDNGEDSCQGDSGGPLTVDSRSQAKQIGVVSWGVGCGRYPGVYTAVYKYSSWINKHKYTGVN